MGGGRGGGAARYQRGPGGGAAAPVRGARRAHVTGPRPINVRQSRRPRVAMVSSASAAAAAEFRSRRARARAFPGPTGPRHGPRRAPRRARAAGLRDPEAAGAGPARLPAGAGPGAGGAGIPHRGGGGEPAGSVPPWAWGSVVGGSRRVPAHARLPAAPREEGPVHRGRPDEPPGPHRQRLHPEGTGAPAGPRRPPPPPAPTRALSPQQHDVDKLYKVETRPAPGASDQ